MPDSLDALRIHGAAGAAPQSGRRRRRRWPWIVAGLAVALVLWWLVKPHARVLALAPVVRAYPSRAITVLTASGYVVAQRKASLAAKITSQLAWIGVEEGSRIKKGQIVATQEHADLEASKERAAHEAMAADAQVKQADAELVDARLNYKRMKTLADRGVVAKSEYDTAKARFDKATAALKQAHSTLLAKREALREATAQLGYTELVAPFDAVVLTKNADVGDIISPLGASSTSKAAVVTIADMSSLTVEVDVAESSLHLVRLGAPCEILLDAIPTERFPGVVHMIVPTADRTKATVLVKVRFDKLDPRVLPEMSAKVAFLSRPLAPGEKASHPAVPTSAVVSRDGRAVVFVVHKGRAVAKPVTPGETMGDLRAVTAGVTVGEQVVAAPPADLRSGDAVAPPGS